MIDIFCIRCGAKLGYRYENAHGVTIKCPCGTKNYITNEKLPENKPVEDFTSVPPKT